MGEKSFFDKLMKDFTETEILDNMSEKKTKDPQDLLKPQFSKEELKKFSENAIKDADSNRYRSRTELAARKGFNNIESKKLSDSKANFEKIKQRMRPEAPDEATRVIDSLDEIEEFKPKTETKAASFMDDVTDQASRVEESMTPHKDFKFSKESMKLKDVGDETIRATKSFDDIARRSEKLKDVGDETIRATTSFDDIARRSEKPGGRILSKLAKLLPIINRVGRASLYAEPFLSSNAGEAGMDDVPAGSLEDQAIEEGLLEEDRMKALRDKIEGRRNEITSNLANVDRRTGMTQEEKIELTGLLKDAGVNPNEVSNLREPSSEEVDDAGPNEGIRRQMVARIIANDPEGSMRERTELDMNREEYFRYKMDQWR